jgi:hypothetical protein
MPLFPGSQKEALPSKTGMEISRLPWKLLKATSYDINRSSIKQKKERRGNGSNPLFDCLYARYVKWDR